METTTGGKNILSKILGDYYYHSIKSFFTCCFEQRGKKKRYVAFVTRRCYCMAYLFYEEYRQERQDSKESYEAPVFLTNGNLFHLTKEIAEKYVSPTDSLEEIPEIWIVDDMMNYGRALYETLDKFKTIFKKAIKAQSKTEEEAERCVADFVRRYVKIKVYAKKKQPNILDISEERSLSSELSLSPEMWNDLSIRFAEAVSCSDIANAAMVISKRSEELPKEKGKWISVNGSYRDREAKTFTLPILNNGLYKCVCVVRYLKKIDENDKIIYRAVPFVLFPEMSINEFEDLWDKIVGRIKDKIGNKGYCGSLNTMFLTEKNPYTNQTQIKEKILEFLQAYIGLVLLHDLESETASCEQYDYQKLSWNYVLYESDNWTDSNRECAEFLKILCKNENDCIIPISDFIEIMERCRSSFSNWNNAQDIKKELPLDEIEATIYEKSMKAEKFAKNVIRHLDQAYTSLKADMHANRGVLLSELISEILEIAKYKVSVEKIIALLLQMADEGVLSILYGKKGENKLYARIADQARILEPRKNYVHLDALEAIQKDYENLALREEQVENEIRDYITNLRTLSGEQVQKEAQQLYVFWKMVNHTEKYSDWSIGLNRHFKLETHGNKNLYKEDISKEVELWNQKKKYSERCRDTLGSVSNYRRMY